MYPGSSGCLSNADHLRKTSPDITTLPEAFKQQGYEVISTGKVFHHEDPQSWTGITDLKSGEFLPNGRGYRFYRPANDEWRTKGEGRNLTNGELQFMTWRSVSTNEDIMHDSRTARWTVQHLERLSQQSKPFFLGVGFSRPHDPFFAPKRFFDLYPLESIKLPQTPADASKVPMMAYHDVFKKAFDKMDHSKRLEFVRAYYASISFMDEQLGLVLDKLDQLDLKHNTLIVFMSDHGYQVGEKDYFNKTLLFERSCRAPLLIAHPKLEQGVTQVDEVVQFIDVMPTVTEICNVPTPNNAEGKSLTPLMRGEQTPWDNVAYSYVNADRSLRTERYRLINWRGQKEALYDHDKDPGEHFNLVDHPEYKEILHKLRQKLKRIPEFK
jgi:arylsulfatase A-like enzyme